MSDLDLENSNKIIAFYGFKGGAGRSLLLANTAALLSSAGRRVLVIDADLEAPGLGDFFDTEGGMLFSEWRLREGFVDFMDALNRAPYHVKVDENIRLQTRSIIRNLLMSEVPSESELSGHRFLTNIPMTLGNSNDPDSTKSKTLRQNGRVVLMGSGTHKVSTDDGSFNFVGKVLDFDAVTVLENEDRKISSREIVGALKEELLSGRDFDDVLIDGRTGYNAASLIMIQNLATDVVMVGASSMQSIDGMARMRPLFTGPAEQSTGINAHMVVSKMSGAESSSDQQHSVEASNEVKRALNRIYHPGEKFWDFPFVQDLVSGDSLIFRRSKRHYFSDTQSMKYLEVLKDFVSRLFPSIDLNLDDAFSKWSPRLGSTVSTDWGDLSSRDEVSVALGTRERIDECVAAIELFLFEPSKTEDPSFPEMDREYINEIGMPEERRVVQSFVGLRLDERALVRVITQQMLEDKGVSVEKVHRISKLIRLSILPNIVTKTQLRSLGLQRMQAGSKIAVEPSSTKTTATEEQNRRVRKRLVEDYCKRIVLAKTIEDRNGISNDIVAVKEDSNDEQFLVFISCLLDFVRMDSKSRVSAMSKFKKIVSSKNAFLPALNELTEHNIFDVARNIVISAGSSDDTAAEWMIEVTEISKFNLCFFEELWINKSLTLPTAELAKPVRQLVLEFESWVSIWAEAVSTGQSYQVCDIPGYPSIQELKGIIEVTQSVAAEYRESSFRTYLRALSTEVFLRFEIGEFATANLVLDESIAVLENFPNTAPKTFPRVEITSLLRNARSLNNSMAAWKLERSFRFFGARSAHSDVDPNGFDLNAYLTSQLVCDDVGLPSRDGLFPRGPDNLNDADNQFLQETYGWWPKASSLVYANKCKDFIEYASDKESLQDDDSVLLFLCSAYARIGDIDNAVSTYNKWLVSSVNSRNNLLASMNSYLVVTNDILRCLLFCGKHAEFDQLFAESTLEIKFDISEICGWALDEREMLWYSRHAEFTKELSSHLRSAERILDRVLERAKNKWTPVDFPLSNSLGGTWEGLGAFSGFEQPSKMRFLLSEILLTFCEMAVRDDARKDQLEILKYLQLVEKIVWGEVINRQNPLCVSSEYVRFFDVSGTSFSLPRVRLERIRDSLGLEFDLDSINREMDSDISSNGPGRRIYYSRFA